MNKEEIQKLVAREVGDYICNVNVATAYNAGDPTYGVIGGDFPFVAASDLEDTKVWLNGSVFAINVFSPADNLIYLKPPFASLPASGASFAIHRFSTPSEYNEVFTQVFSRLSGKVLVDREASMAVASTRLYSPPSNWKYINTIEIFKADTELPTEVAHSKWKVRAGKVAFATLFSTSDYPTMSFLGQGHPTPPANATAALEQSGIFQSCLAYRMVETLGMRLLNKVTTRVTGTASEDIARSSSLSRVGSIGATMTSTATLTGSRDASITFAGSMYSSLGLASTLSIGYQATILGTIIGTLSRNFGATTNLTGTRSLGATITTTNVATIDADRLGTTTLIEHLTGKVTVEDISDDEIQQSTNTEVTAESENSQEREVSTEIESSSEARSESQRESRIEAQEEKQQEDSVETQAEVTSETEQQTDIESRLTSELENTYELSAGTMSNADKQTEEDWLSLIMSAKSNADALEEYLFERVRPNSRMLVYA